MAFPLGDADSFSWLSIKQRAVRQAPPPRDDDAADARGLGALLLQISISMNYLTESDGNPVFPQSSTYDRILKSIDGGLHLTIDEFKRRFCDQPIKLVQSVMRLRLVQFSTDLK